MKLKLLFIMSLVLILSASPAFMADTIEYNEQAEILKELDLFSGTNNGFELDRAPKRVEVAAMLVKFLGAEEEANSKKYSHPFTDVPDWADNLIGYMYEKNLTTGIGNNKFGSNNLAGVRDYTVFVLKALGYDMTDFEYANTMNFAVEKGLISSSEKASLEASTFQRGEMVFLSYNSLFTPTKGNSLTLGDKLGKTDIKKVMPTVTKVNDAFLSGLSTRYEWSVNGFDSTQNELVILNDVISINATKQLVRVDSTSSIENIPDPQDPTKMARQYKTEVDGYKGVITLKEGIKQWENEPVYYTINFYHGGKFIKSVDYARLSGRSNSTEFQTPFEPFDEIRVIAYPLKEKNYGINASDFVKIFHETDKAEILELIESGSAMQGMGMGYTVLNPTSIEDLKQKLLVKFSSGTHYEDGSFFRMFQSRILKPSVDYPAEIEFVDEDVLMIEGNSLDPNDDSIYESITYNIKTTPYELKDTLNIFIVYGEGFAVKNVFMVFE